MFNRKLRKRNMGTLPCRALGAQIPPPNILAPAGGSNPEGP